MIVSKFNNVKDIIPQDISLEEWLLSTKDVNSKHVIDVLKYRMTSNKEFKNNLPCITVSSSLDNYRNLNNIKQKNNLICLDIDRYSKSKKKTCNLCIDMAQVKEFFKSHPCCLYAGLSTGGDGVYAIIRLEYADKLDEYFEHFKVKLSRLGINIDESCKDYTRLRFFSFDPDAYYNPDAKYYGFKKEVKQKPEKAQNNISKTDTDKVEAIIALLESHKIDITSTYEDWIKIGGALYGSFGEGGRDYFHRISRLYPDYKFQDADSKFNNCKKLNKTSISSLFYIATQYGIRY